MLAGLSALFALVLATVCLAAAQSSGAIVFCIPAAAVLLGLTKTKALPITARAAILAGTLLTSVAVIIAAVGFFDDASGLLELLGKDSTLTGRTYLWQRGQELLAQAPAFGVGYQAFWQVGNPPAEELWAASLVGSGSGFNFQNLYINTGVELGYAGLVLLLAMLLWLALRLLRAIVLNPCPSGVFAAGVFVYLISSSFIEVALLYPFYLGSFLFGLVWVYAGRPPYEPVRKRHSPLTSSAVKGNSAFLTGH